MREGAAIHSPTSLRVLEGRDPVEDESYHSAKSEPDEDMSPPVAPIVSRASRTEPQEADQAPKMHIDPEEPRDPSTVLRSHPRRFVVHRSGDPHYQYDVRVCLARGVEGNESLRP